jgi:hypothetical protein
MSIIARSTDADGRSMIQPNQQTFRVIILSTQTRGNFENCLSYTSGHLVEWREFSHVTTRVLRNNNKNSLELKQDNRLFFKLRRL